MLAIIVSYTMIVLDISIVITALPKIHYGLGLSAAALSCVQNAYLLTFGGLLLLGTRAGDLSGRRRLFIAGLALFTVASWRLARRSPSLADRRPSDPGDRRRDPRPVDARAAADHVRGRPRANSRRGLLRRGAEVAATVGLVVGHVRRMVSWRVGFFVNAPIGSR